VKPSEMRGKPISGEGAPRWRFARLLRATVVPLLLAAYRTRFLGVGNVPEGPVIFAGNHVSYLDPALLWSGAPREMHFIAKEELWSIGWLGWALDRLWVIPVKRSSADREMIAAATSLLARGESIGMFPEGTRSRDVSSDELGSAHGGVSFIALRAGVPIIPVGIAGTDKALPAGAKLPRFPRVTMLFGEPVRPEHFEGDRKQRMEAMTAELMKRIAASRDAAREA